MKDNNLVCVAEERRRLMHEFGDMIFDGADQADIDAKYKEYAAMKQLDNDGVRYVPRF